MKSTHKCIGSTCVLVSYPSGKKYRFGTWLEDEANELNLPVFLSKVGREEPTGFNRIAKQIKKLVYHS